MYSEQHLNQFLNQAVLTAIFNNGRASLGGLIKLQVSFTLNGLNKLKEYKLIF